MEKKNNGCLTTCSWILFAWSIFWVFIWLIVGQAPLAALSCLFAAALCFPPILKLLHRPLPTLHPIVPVALAVILLLWSLFALILDTTIWPWHTPTEPSASPEATTIPVEETLTPTPTVTAAPAVTLTPSPTPESTSAEVSPSPTVTPEKTSNPTPTDKPTPTAEPTPAEIATSTPAPTAILNDSNDNSPSETSAEEPEGEIVWISSGGKRYHADPDCSGMRNPTKTTKEKAESNGRTPCKTCYLR